MISQIWGVIKLLNALYQFILWAMGKIKTAQYIEAIKKIDEAAAKAGNPELPVKERLENGAKIEDEFNKRA